MNTDNIPNSAGIQPSTGLVESWQIATPSCATLARGYSYCTPAAYKTNGNRKGLTLYGYRCLSESGFTRLQDEQDDCYTILPILSSPFRRDSILAGLS
ncbi:MAG: hypothetical protein LBN71_03625 [Tannerella sp.]|nr:hypothetical protein [Tannerella sp.]